MRLVAGARQRLRYHPTRRLAGAIVLLSPLWLLTALGHGWWAAAVVALGILVVDRRDVRVDERALHQP